MAIEENIRRAMRGTGSPRHADALIADVAARQHGLVTRPQLMALGIGPDAIDRDRGATAASDPSGRVRRGPPGADAGVDVASRLS